MIKVGIIGYGFSAKTFHLPFILSTNQYQLVAISTSKLNEAHNDYPQQTIYASADELIEQAEIDLVIITAPNAVHFSLAKACLLKSLHVVIEKPMTTTVQEGETLIALAKIQKVMLSVYHNRRWDGDFLTVKNLLAKQTLGNVHIFESHFDRFRPLVRDRWRENPGAGAGIWFDLGSHLIDQALCLFGLPTSVTARCLSLRENSATVDYFHVQLHYEKLEVILHSSPHMAASNKRFQLDGSKGCYIKYGLDPQEEQLKAGLSPLHKDFGVELNSEFAQGHLYYATSDEALDTQAGNYSIYYQQLADAIKGKHHCPVSGEEALQVIKLLVLAQESSDKGQTLTL